MNHFKRASGSQHINKRNTKKKKKNPKQPVIELRIKLEEFLMQNVQKRKDKELGLNTDIWLWSFDVCFPKLE